MRRKYLHIDPQGATQFLDSPSPGCSYGVSHMDASFTALAPGFTSQGSAGKVDFLEGSGSEAGRGGNITGDEADLLVTCCVFKTLMRTPGDLLPELLVQRLGFRDLDMLIGPEGKPGDRLFVCPMKYDRGAFILFVSGPEASGHEQATGQGTPPDGSAGAAPEKERDPAAAGSAGEGGKQAGPEAAVEIPVRDSFAVTEALMCLPDEVISFPLGAREMLDYAARLYYELSGADVAHLLAAPPDEGTQHFVSRFRPSLDALPPLELSRTERCAYVISRIMGVPFTPGSIPEGANPLEHLLLQSKGQVILRRMGCVVYFGVLLLVILLVTLSFTSCGR